MSRGIGLRPRLIRGAALTFAGITAGCAHVGQDQFDAEVAALRAEIELTTSGSNRRTGRDRADHKRFEPSYGSALGSVGSPARRACQRPFPAGA